MSSQQRAKDTLEAVRDSLHHSEQGNGHALRLPESRGSANGDRVFGRHQSSVIPAVADENAKRSPFVEISDDVMRASFDKFWGQVYVTQAAAPKMPAGGSITLFSSVAAFRPPQPQSGLSVMNAVQGAIAALGRSLTRELAPVRVNVMVPGVVLTNVWKPEERESLTQWMESSLPSQYAGQPGDIAHAVLYLMTNSMQQGPCISLMVDCSDLKLTAQSH
jgi:NAD(P)-dependent dehydrogenase (short-subunit alcohol dehydrogenase family)